MKHPTSKRSRMRPRDARSFLEAVAIDKRQWHGSTAKLRRAARPLIESMDRRQLLSANDGWSVQYFNDRSAGDVAGQFSSDPAADPQLSAPVATQIDAFINNPGN